ncbi:MAG TPA: lamin tail domain-containing protein [Verrucomicrobiales bacterium]|nr:lamin tail domain-containing protein [Verrucomicrobiales bacterium]
MSYLIAVQRFLRIGALSTLASVLASPLVLQAGQVAFTEIMYQPAGELPEFIEITNLTSTPLDMEGWILEGGVELAFPEFSAGAPQNHFLHAFERLVVTGADESTFRVSYIVPPNVRVMGPWTGSLDDRGERITLRDRHGVIQSTVHYKGSGRWPAAADGTGYSLTLLDPDETSDDRDNWSVSKRRGGSPGSGEVSSAEEAMDDPQVELDRSVRFLDYGTEWKFHDGNEDLGTEWRELDYDDSAWASGPGLLGFEDADLPEPGIQTPLRQSPPEEEHFTYYFRAEFQYDEETEGATLSIDQIVDDGVAYYLNGVFVGAVGMPDDFDWKTPASRNVDNAAEESDALTPDDIVLLPGRNVLAAEVHQSSATSSDCVFGLRLNITPPPSPHLVINEVLPLQGPAGFIEFYNPTETEIDLLGHFLSDDPMDLDKFPLTTSTVAPPLGFAVINYAGTGLDPGSTVEIYLTDPNGRSLDGISATATLDGRSMGRKPEGASTWYRFLEPTPEEPNASIDVSLTTLRFNEVHHTAGNRLDWIELANLAPADAVPLDGLFLASLPDFSNRVPLEGEIPAGGYQSQAVDFPFLSSSTITLYLINSAGQVLQARSIDRRPEGVSVQAFPPGSNEWYAGGPATPGEPNTPDLERRIVINEIMFQPPSGDRSGEYIEIINRGDDPVDLSEWEFTEGVIFTFNRGTTLEPGDFLVIAASVASVSADKVAGEFDGSLSDSGGRIRLVDASGNLVDQVDYRPGGAWPRLAAGGGSSLELIHPDMDNSLPSAWRASDESEKSSFARFTISGIYRGLDVIGMDTDYRELHFHLGGPSHVILRNMSLTLNGAGNNFLARATAISNTGSGADGWLCQGNHAGSFFDRQNFHLVAEGPGDNRANRAEFDITGIAAFQTYELTFQARWVSGTPRIIAQTWDHSIGGAFAVPIPENLGTPGSPNSRLIAFPEPQIAALRHSPAVPAPDTPVRIIAEIQSDPDSPLASVEVMHRADSSNDSTPWLQTPMLDDGLDGDDYAGDGIFTATLTDYPMDGQIVQFYVVATGENSASSQFPAAAPERPALWVVDAGETPADLNSLRFVVSARDLDALGANGGTAAHQYRYPRLSDHYFNATFISNEDKIFYGTEIRKSGNPQVRAAGNGLARAEWRTPGDRPFRGRIEHAYDENAASDDLRYDSRLTRYWLSLLGHPASDNEFVRVIINGSEPALREAVEPVDQAFLERRLVNGAQGELYAMEDEWWFEDDWTSNSRNADWTFKDATEPARYHTEWARRTRAAEYDYGALIAMMRAISGENITEDEINRMFDPDLMALHAAVRGYAGDWDSASNNRGDNEYFYRKSTDGRFMFLHRDSELAFTGAGAPFLPDLNGVSLYYQQPSVRRLYQHYLTVLLDSYTAGSARLNAWFDAEENASGVYAVNRNRYTGWFTNRRAGALAQIGNSYTAGFSISTGDGSSLTTSEDTLTLEGESPSSVYLVRVAGHPEAVFRWRAENAWELSGIVLSRGTTLLIVEGVDSTGNVVHSTTFAVNKPENAPPVVVLDSHPTPLDLPFTQRLELDASPSYDPEGAALLFHWEASPPEDLVLYPVSPSRTSAVFARPGLYTFIVSAEDASGAEGSANREASVYAPGDRYDFDEPMLPAGLEVLNAVPLAVDPGANWYSLDDDPGSLAIYVQDRSPNSLSTRNSRCPIIQRPMPAGGDWSIQTELTLTGRQLGRFMAGLTVEMLEGEDAQRYAIGLRDGDTLAALYPGRNNLSDLAAIDFPAGNVTLRIRRDADVLRFDYRTGPSGPWQELASQEIAPESSGLTGGVFVSTSLAQSVRASFDYLMLVDPSGASPLQRSLRVSEILYRPLDGNPYEFIEFTNTGPETISLAGTTLSGGDPVETLVLGDVQLDPGAFTVVSASASALRAIYGDQLPVAAEWPGGNLSDLGERIEILDPSGRIIQSFIYSSGAGWPQEASLSGKSLEVLDPHGDYSLGENWRASAETGGSPGGFVLSPGGSPLLGLSQTTFQFFSYVGEPAAAQRVAIRNAAASDETMTYTISGLPDWLSATPDQGSSASPLEINEHTLSLATGAIPPGEYFAELTVDSPEAANSPQTVFVSLSLTDPNDPDGDGLSNAEEEALGTDPALADTDGDGFNDGLEVALGTDPLDGSSSFRILSADAAADGSSVFITWTSAPGNTYLLESSQDLAGEGWQTLMEVPGAEEADETTAEDHPPAGASQLLYRVRFKGAP